MEYRVISRERLSHRLFESEIQNNAKEGFVIHSVTSTDDDVVVIMERQEQVVDW